MDDTVIKEKQKVLEKYQILDTSPESEYDDLAIIAMRLCDAPTALVTFVDYSKSRIFFKSNIGYEIKYLTYENIESSFCYHCIPDKLLILNDVDQPELFKLTIEDGIRFYAGAPITVPSGHVLGSLCVLDKVPRTLTEFQQESLMTLSKQIVTHLELRLRFLELSEMKTNLQTQQDDLKNLVREKNDFVRAVSHDIRQPLGNILLSCELTLQDSEISDSYEDQIQMVHTNAGLMHLLVDDLLQTVSIDFGKPVELETKPVNIVQLTYNVVNMNVLLAAKKHIQFLFYVKHDSEKILLTSHDKQKPTSIMCLVDPSKIEQVINNLLSNAVKFSYSHSKVEVFVEYNSSSNELVLMVTDNGQGIPSHDMEKMFQPFQKLSVKPTAGESSNSLGLCIVKSIVESHNGTIKVDSAVGKGTTFTVTLPVIIPTATAEKPKNTESKSFTRSKIYIPPNKSLRVLVADDNLINQKLLYQILKKRGHEVDLASDGIDAIDLFHKNGGHKIYDVLLIDEEMPKMKGTEVVMKIREHEKLKRLKRIPMISISGHSSEEHFIRMKDTGVDSCLTKPFQSEKLVNLVESLATQ